MFFYFSLKPKLTKPINGVRNCWLRNTLILPFYYMTHSNRVIVTSHFVGTIAILITFARVCVAVSGAVWMDKWIFVRSISTAVSIFRVAGIGSPLSWLSWPCPSQILYAGWHFPVATDRHCIDCHAGEEFTMVHWFMLKVVEFNE